MGLDPLHLALSRNSVRFVLNLASLSFRKAMLSFFVRLLLWVPELSRSQRLPPQSKLQLVPSHRNLVSEHHRIKWSLLFSPLRSGLSELMHTIVNKNTIFINHIERILLLDLNIFYYIQLYMLENR